MTPVQIDGTKIMWLPFPTARSWQQWELGSHERATYRARIISEIHSDRYEPSEDTPFWALMVAWMRFDAPRLAPSSFSSYAIDARELDRIIGRAPLRACHDKVILQELFNVLDAEDASESKRRQIARTLGSICSWAQGTPWWPHREEVFGHHDSRRKIKFAAFGRGREADIRSNRAIEQIRADVCPRFEETVSFALDLREHCVDRWGADAAYLGDFPVVQYITGTRFSEVLALKPTNFSLADPLPSVRVAAQADSDRPYCDRHPTLTTTKNGEARSAALWAWSVDVLEEIVGRAAAQGREFIFTAPVDIRTFPRQFQAVYQATAETSGYSYTSHWHRHAYATYNLAPISQGGYNRSLKDVSSWLGHARIGLTADRYWHPVELEAGWSDHRPGKAP